MNDSEVLAAFKKLRVISFDEETILFMKNSHNSILVPVQFDDYLRCPNLRKIYLGDVHTASTQ
jgi:hypothetical protein